MFVERKQTYLDDLKCVNVLRSWFDGFSCSSVSNRFVNCITQQIRCVFWVCVTYSFDSLYHLCRTFNWMRSRGYFAIIYSCSSELFMCEIFFPIFFLYRSFSALLACALPLPTNTVHIMNEEAKHENRIKDVKEKRMWAVCAMWEWWINIGWVILLSMRWTHVQARTQYRPLSLFFFYFHSFRLHRLVNRTVGWRFECDACFNPVNVNKNLPMHTQTVMCLCARECIPRKMRATGNLLYSRFIYIGTSRNK